MRICGDRKIVACPQDQSVGQRTKGIVCLQNVGTQAILTQDGFLSFLRRTCGIGVYLFVASFEARKPTFNVLLFLNVPPTPPEHHC